MHRLMKLHATESVFSSRNRAGSRPRRDRFLRRTTAASARRLVAAALAATAAGGVAAAPVTLRREALAMGTRVAIEVEAADRGAALAAGEAALRAVEAVEARLSTWRVESELARFNRSPEGAWFGLSPELERDLRAAAWWRRETGGAFEPGLAALVAAWGLREGGRVPDAARLAAARKASGLELLELGGGRARRLAAGFGIEEGGFGKGVALAEAGSAAVTAGARCVWLDLGGQVLLAGRCADRGVAVAHPADRQRTVAELRLRAGSLASSGNSERGLRVGGVAVGHILDPASGRPVADWGGVTVWAADPVAADCLATALYVMGPERGLAWASGRQEVEALFVVREGAGLRLRATWDGDRALGASPAEWVRRSAPGRPAPRETR